MQGLKDGPPFLSRYSSSVSMGRRGIQPIQFTTRTPYLVYSSLALADLHWSSWIIWRPWWRVRTALNCMTQSMLTGGKPSLTCWMSRWMPVDRMCCSPKMVPISWRRNIKNKACLACIMGRGNPEPALASRHSRLARSRSPFHLAACQVMHRPRLELPAVPDNR